MQKRIVMIMTDSQRWDMVGCYGNPSMHTPCLDHLASEGLRFDRAYTTQPVCGPVRSWRERGVIAFLQCALQSIDFLYL